MQRLLSLIFVAAVQTSAMAGELPPDPLQSTMWKEMAERLLSSGPIEFDDRVKIVIPSVVEDQAQVPITADARALEGVVRLIVFADLNPVQHVLTLTPASAAPFVSLRMKVEQATPVRAAAQTADGTWHVGGIYLDASGGGCSAPAMARKDADWSDFVGQAQGKLWREPDGLARARLRVRHPMDTGLAKDNTPAYFIERLEMRSLSGASLATLELFEPVSEDPTVTLLVRLPPSDAAVTVEGRDNNGNIYKSRLAASWRQSAIPRRSAPC